MIQQELSIHDIGNRIYFIRGHRVLLDGDLALLYQVKTKSLNQAVRRNIERFPNDFMFQLSEKELEILRSQIGTIRLGAWGKHSKYLPFVFTEQGVSMLSSVLRSKTAIQVNVEIMRTFVKLRGVLETNKDIAKKLEQLEQKFSLHDQNFKVVFDAIRKLMATEMPITQKKIRGLNNN